MKSVIFAIFGVFLAHLTPCGSLEKKFSRENGTKFIFTLILSTLSQSFRKIKRADQTLCGEKCHFLQFLSILAPFDPCGSLTKILSRAMVLDLYSH